MTLVWNLLALVGGVLIGWLIWGRRIRRNAAAAAERDRLQGVVGLHESREAADRALHRRLRGELERRATRLGELEGQLQSAQRMCDERAEAVSAAEARAGAEANRVAHLESRLGSAEALAEKLQADLDAAELALRAGDIEVDDLKAIEGIGPKIEELLHGDGISTWEALASAPVDRLVNVLAASGPRFRLHDPGSWPRQAALLAEGRWDEFKELTSRLDGRR